MKIFPHLTICPQCDGVYLKKTGENGKVAMCENCHAILWRGNEHISRNMLPLVLTALITFSMACTYPVMYVDFHGVRNGITLWDVSWALADGNSIPLMAISTTFLLIIAPLLQMTLTGWLLLFARFERPAPAFVIIMKSLKWLYPWSMVEVGVLGFVISSIKLSALLDVSVGLGGWALVVSCLLIIFINSNSLQSLWDLLNV